MENNEDSQMSGGSTLDSRSTKAPFKIRTICVQLRPDTRTQGKSNTLTLLTCPSNPASPPALSQRSSATFARRGAASPEALGACGASGAWNGAKAVRTSNPSPKHRLP